VRPVVLEFVGGYWGGKTLRTDSAELEETLLAAACYETCHHGAIGEGCAGLSEYAVGFAVHHQWPGATHGGWQGAYRYSVTERWETEDEIVIRLGLAAPADASRPPAVGVETRELHQDQPGVSAGNGY
jgi:hypothetical protein